MIKIYLAIGHKDLETYIKSNTPLLEQKLNTEVLFIGEAVYREGIIKNIQNDPPDILILREGLQGQINISDLIYQIKLSFPTIRIIFIAGDRNIGDSLLSILVQYGVYDLIIGSRVNVKDILRRICKANTLADVAYLMPKVSINEISGEKVFEAPNIDILEHSKKQADIDGSNVKLESQNKKVTDLIKTITEEEDIKYQNNSIEDNIINEREKMLSQDFGKTRLTPLNLKKEEEFKESEPMSQKTSKQTSQFQGHILNTQVLKESSKYLNKYSQRIITFLGGSSGIGNTQMSFQTALNYALKGSKTIYIDLNSNYCSMDSLFQISFENIGLEIALSEIDRGNLIEIERAIATPSKLLSFVQSGSNLFKLYNKLPEQLDFLTFSQEFVNKKSQTVFNSENFNQLIEYLITKMEYEHIVIDASNNIHDDLNLLSTMICSKLICTISQDYAMLTHHLNMMRYLDREHIEFRNKIVYILNRFIKSSISAKNIYQLISSNLSLQTFQMVTIPDIYGDFLIANSVKTPIIWCTKNKPFITGLNNIVQVLQ